ncbi:hypothetical protein EsH8_IX_000497 [Colletotrichum jinshuiense]
MAVISRLSQLTDEQQRMCDDLLIVLIQRNYPLDPPTLDQIRDEFWTRVFMSGWNTDVANPSPPTLRKRTSNESALLIGTLNQDVPKNGTIPPHRRAGQPVSLKVSLKTAVDRGIIEASFFWIDQQGHRGSELSNASIDIEGGLTLAEAKVEVSLHYDINEKGRVGVWNWSKVTHWGRARLINLAHNNVQGEAQNGLENATGEDMEELKQIRLVEEHWIQGGESAQVYVSHGIPGGAIKTLEMH